MEEITLEDGGEGGLSVFGVASTVSLLLVGKEAGEDAHSDRDCMSNRHEWYI